MGVNAAEAIFLTSGKAIFPFAILRRRVLVRA